MKPAAVLALVALSTLSVVAQDSTPVSASLGVDAVSSIMSRQSSVIAEAKSAVSNLTPSQIRESLSSRLASITQSIVPSSSSVTPDTKEGAGSHISTTGKITIGIAAGLSVSLLTIAGILA